jgi:hypothetical protein
MLMGKNEQEITSLLGPPDEFREHVLVYRVYRKNGFHKYPIPKLPGDECEEGFWELTFDLTIEVPGDAYYQFSLYDTCWVDDS